MTNKVTSHFVSYSFHHGFASLEATADFPLFNIKCSLIFNGSHSGILWMISTLSIFSDTFIVTIMDGRRRISIENFF